MQILVVYSTPRPFIDLDVRLLRTAHRVETACLHLRPRSALVRSSLRAAAAAVRADVVISWFGALHALPAFCAAKVLRRPCAVIASGFDVASVPEIGYGHMRGGPLCAIGRGVFQMADRVWAVSEFTAREAVRNAGVAPAKLRIIPHGVDVRALEEATLHAKRPEVLMVATAARRTLALKGLPTFLEAARLLPEVPFCLAGSVLDAAARDLRTAAPPNVTFTGWLAPEALRRRMRRAAVYAQLSAYESFGMALAEAMAEGCVPVTTRRGALPEVVGNAGWHAPYGDAPATAEAIRAALKAGPEAGRRAHAQIASAYPLERRRARLLEAVSEAAALR